MSRILITGGAGFIGAHLSKKLQKNNKVMIVDKLEKKGGLLYIDKNNYFIKGDITNPKIIKKIKNWKPEIIFHLAAQSGGEGAYDNPKNDFVSNGYGTYLIAKLAKELNCKYFIYSSSVAVYGSNMKKRISEKMKLNPDSIYGISKYSGEMFIKQILKNTNTKVRIFRIFNTYGPGENLNNLKKGIVGIYCYYVWKKKPIIVKGSLNRFRNIVYIADCVNILEKSIYNKLLKKFEVINLTTGKKIYVKDIIKTILKVNKIKKYKIQVRKKTPGDSLGFDSSNKYLLKKFKKYKFTTLENGLKKYFNWISLIKSKNLNKSHPYLIDKNFKL